jgi:hypothetical protein
MAVPYYDFLMSPPTDQTGSALGTDFDYYNAFLNNSQYYQPGTGTTDMANFTIGDQEYSFPSGSTYNQLEKYMTDKGASDLLTRTGAIAPIDGGSDSTGIGEIILPPIAGGGGGGGGVTPEFLKTYTTGATADKSQAVNVDGTTMLDVPSTQVLGTGIIPAYGKYPTDFTLGNVYTGEFDDSDEGTVFDSTEPKQNFLQKGIGSIKNFFTDSKFFQPKIQGQLGTRLANQYTMGQKLPSFIGAIAGMQSPFNPKSKNYNPLLENQLNIAEANDKVGRDPNSGSLKYNTNSVLSGQNVISGFGTNDYEKQLENYLDKVQGVFDKKYGDVDITEYEDFSLKDLKALDPKNALDAKKIAAATYKTKYINAAITELDPFKNKTYIEKKKEIEQQKEAQKIKDAAEKELQEKMTNIGNVKAAQQAQANKDYQRVQRAYREDTGPGPGSYAPGGGSGEQSDGSYNDPFDPGGGEKDGGHIDGTNRRRFGEGGIVTL